MPFKGQMLRVLVTQRLSAAAEDIFGLFERTIAEYEQELCRSKEENRRQRHLLDAVFNAEVHLKQTDVQQVLVGQVENLLEQQEWRCHLDNNDPEPPHVKEEQEDTWARQDREQLPGLEESDIGRFTWTDAPVKSEDEEKPSQCHQSPPETREAEPRASSLAEHMKTEADGEPDPNLDPRESETNNIDGWKQNTETLSDLKSLKSDEETCSCSECGKRLKSPENLKRHMTVHRAEKPFSCSECNKIFKYKISLKRHMRIHTGEKPFKCSVCAKRFNQTSLLTYHMRGHTGEKPFSCSICQKRFRQSGHVVTHMRVHTGERPYTCSICNRGFTQRRSLSDHMTVHTGEKIHRCNICGKRYSRKPTLKKHKCAFNQPQTNPQMST
ncbi:zinc finger protein 501-like [Thalassophryne amazonica]|uniref:zinc finger protein 501-like n=1 Tax=Thalassophryne amazonica TaxID=390379 RepID=UPI0014711753|nr:zinc finger protein 501-like [Thalassophryne amazonica]